MKTRSRVNGLLIALALGLSVSACSSSETVGNNGGNNNPNPNPTGGLSNYIPFDPSNFANQTLRVQVYQDFANGRGTITQALLTDFQTQYAGGAGTTYGNHQLQTKVQGREDDHAYTSDATPGVEMDLIITEAVTRGLPLADGSNLQKDQGQIIDKTLLRFFYQSIFHEMFKGINETRNIFNAGNTTEGNETQNGPKNWDEAFGYFGMSENRTDYCRGVCATVQKRAGNFPNAFGGMKDDVFNALVTGREALEDGDFTTAEAQRDLVDKNLLLVFAVSCAREFAEYQTQSTDAGKVTKLIEARIFADILEDYVRRRTNAQNLFPTASVTAGSDTDADLMRNAVNTYDLDGNLRAEVEAGNSANLIDNSEAQAVVEMLERHFGFTYANLN